MRNKLIMLFSLVAIMGLGVRGSALVDNPQIGPAQVSNSASLSSARDNFKASPPEVAHLLNKGEKVVEITVLSNPNPEDTLSFDGSDLTNAVGLTGSGTFEAAIRLTPTELASFAGWEIVAILWYHFELPDHIVDSLMVYGNGTPTTPGPLLHSQPASLTSLGWLREDLTSPVPITGSSDLWAGIWFTQSDTAFPAGIDAGPAVPFKGDMILFSGSWGELRNFGLDFNWHIRAIVDSGAVPPNLDVRPLTINSPAGVVMPNTSLFPATTVRNQGLDPATFDVICNIDSSGGPQVYSDTFNFVNLASSTDSSITFGPWTPGGSGAVYDVTVFTTLSGDQVPSNDTLMSATLAFDTSITPIPSPYTTNPPVVDGFLSPGEWSDAYMLDVTDVLGLPDAADPPGSAILYVKNDASNVYFALDAVFDMTTNDFDELGVYLDDNHDAVFPSAPDTSEGNIWFDNIGAGDQAIYRWIQSGPVFDLAPYYTTGFPVQVTMTSGHQQFEAVVPLGTLPAELDAAPGDTVGVFFLVLDNSAFSFYGWWPYNVNASTGWYDPSTYGDLILGISVGAEEETPEANHKPFALFQTRPNPITSTAEILYQLPTRGEVSLSIYDITGRLVRTLVNGTQDAGAHRVVWDARDERGLDVSSGLYFYRLSTGKATTTRKLVLLR